MSVQRGREKKATNTRKLCQLPIATGTKTRVTEKRGKYNKRLFSMPSKVNSISFSLSESEVYQNVRTNSINWSRSSLFRSVKLLLFGPLRRAFLGNLFACPWIKPETWIGEVGPKQVFFFFCLLAVVELLFQSTCSSGDSSMISNIFVKTRDYCTC